MTVANLIAVRPILVDGRKLPPGSLFTVDAEHAPALLATGEAATSPIAAASYGVIYRSHPRALRASRAVLAGRMGCPGYRTSPDPGGLARNYSREGSVAPYPVPVRRLDQIRNHA